MGNQNIIKEVAERMGIVPRLHLGTKLEGGGVKSTGPHLATFVGSELVTGKDWDTQVERREIRLNLLEKGQKCFYQFPLRGKKGEPHYLIAALVGIKEGSELILEMKNRRAKTFVEVRAPGEVGRI